MALFVCFGMQAQSKKEKDILIKSAQDALLKYVKPSSVYGSLLNISSIVLALCLLVVQSCKSPVISLVGFIYNVFIAALFVRS